MTKDKGHRLDRIERALENLQQQYENEILACVKLKQSTVELRQSTTELRVAAENFLQTALIQGAK
jgi:gluconate kinase